MPLSRLLLRGREGWLAGGRSGVQPSGAPPEVPPCTPGLGGAAVPQGAGASGACADVSLNMGCSLCRLQKPEEQYRLLYEVCQVPVALCSVHGRRSPGWAPPLGGGGRLWGISVFGSTSLADFAACFLLNHTLPIRVARRCLCWSVQADGTAGVLGGRVRAWPGGLCAHCREGDVSAAGCSLVCPCPGLTGTWGRSPPACLRPHLPPGEF